MVVKQTLFHVYGRGMQIIRVMDQRKAMTKAEIEAVISNLEDIIAWEIDWYIVDAAMSELNYYKGLLNECN